MFIRELDVVDNEKSSSSLMLGIPYDSIFDEGHQLCRWSKFKNYPAEEMYKIVQEQVFPFIKGLHGDEESAYSKYMADAIFKIPTPQLLEQIVTAVGADGGMTVVFRDGKKICRNSKLHIDISKKEDIIRAWTR